METIRVRMFGEFSLELDSGVRVSSDHSRSVKIWRLVAYLLYHRDRMIPREELLRLLGDSDRNGDPARMLRNTRWNARRVLEPLSDALGVELLISKGNNNGWNPDVPVDLDAENFVRLLSQAEESQDEDVRLEELLQAIVLFQGEFLEKLTDEPWAEQTSAFFHNRYIEAVQSVLPLLEARARNAEAVRICKNALRISPYHESLHRELMRAYLRLEDLDAADSTYQALRDMLYSELGVLPEKATQELYQEVAQRKGGRSVPLDTLRYQLREHSMPTGALICDYPTFKLFYQVEARSADRRGDAIHAGVLSVVPKEGDTLSQKSLEKAMSQLCQQIQNTLRVGDVAACCSGSQYIMLLVQANYENSQMICNRVIKAFAYAHPKSPAAITAAVIPLEPVGR